MHNNFVYFVPGFILAWLLFAFLIVIILGAAIFPVEGLLLFITVH